MIHSSNTFQYHKKKRQHSSQGKFLNIFLFYVYNICRGKRNLEGAGFNHMPTSWSILSQEETRRAVWWNREIFLAYKYCLFLYLFFFKKVLERSKIISLKGWRNPSRSSEAENAGEKMSHFGRTGPPDISDTYSLLVLNITFRKRVFFFPLRDFRFRLFLSCLFIGLLFLCCNRHHSWWSVSSFRQVWESCRYLHSPR